MDPQLRKKQLAKIKRKSNNFIYTSKSIRTTEKAKENKLKK